MDGDERVDRGGAGNGAATFDEPGAFRESPRLRRTLLDAAANVEDDDAAPVDGSAAEDTPPPAAELMADLAAKKLPPTPRRVQAWQDLRSWERDKARRLHDHGGSLKGPTVVRARDEGRLRPYYAGALKRAAGWWKGELPGRLVNMLGWVLMGQKLGRPGVTLAHRHVGELEGVSKRTAGTWMRRAANAGLIVRQTNYAARGKGHRQLANTYRPAPKLLALVERLAHGKRRATLAAAHPAPTPAKYEGGKDFHPTKNSRFQRLREEEEKESAPRGAESIGAQRLRTEGASAKLVRQLTGARIDEDLAPEIARALIAFQRVTNQPAT
jgi:hypothetical protein